MTTTSKKHLYLKQKEIQYYLGLSSEETEKLLESQAFPVLWMGGVPYVPKNAFFGWLEAGNLGGVA